MSRTVNVTGYAAVSLTQEELTSSFLEISISSERLEGEVYANYRTPFPRTFFGYYQLAYGSTMLPARQLETQFQLVYRAIDPMPGLLSRFCELGDYVKYLKERLDLSFSITFPAPPNFYAVSIANAFSEYQRALPHLHPSSILVRADAGAGSRVLIIHQAEPIGLCERIPDCSFEPTGCWDFTTDPLSVSPNCTPAGPGGGGSST